MAFAKKSGARSNPNEKMRLSVWVHVREQGVPEVHHFLVPYRRDVTQEEVIAAGGIDFTPGNANEKFEFVCDLPCDPSELRKSRLVTLIEE